MRAGWAALVVVVTACGAGPDDTAAPASTGDGDAAVVLCTPEAGDAQSVTLGEPLTLSASLAAGEAASWLWDLGDGSVVDGQVVEHRYSEAGVYSAVVQCTSPDGSRGTDAVSITATRALAAVPPVWSGTLAQSADGATLYAVNPEDDSLAVIQADTGAVEIWPACVEPRTVAAQAGAVAVACGGEDALLVFDAATGAAARVDLPSGARPHGVVGRDGAWLATVPARGSVVHVSNDGAVTEVAVGPDPRGLAWLADGSVVITRWRSPDAGGQLYRLGADLAALPDIWLDLDRGGDSDTTTGGVPNLLEQVVPSPDGGALHLPFAHANLLRGSWRTGQPLTHDSTVRAVVATLDAETGEEAGGRKQLDERGRANALAPSPRGERLYVLHTGTRSVTVLDTATGDLAGSLLDVGRAPTGLVASPDGATLYVHAWLDRRVAAYDVRDLSALVESTWSAVTVEVEPLSPEVLLGKQIFWDAKDPRITRAGYISCANCHPDGDHDGRTWDFTDRGEGLRNTPTLLGRAGMGMGPVHWSANFDEIQDFENDMRGPFGGAGFLSDADWAAAGDTLGSPKAGRSAELDALAAYVATLDATPDSPFALPDGGAAAFDAAGCGDCHPAPLYTDSNLADFTRHDVGTLSEASGQRLGDGPLDGLDTPTLLGAWATAPYLHDGSAATVEQAIEAHTALDPLGPDTVALLADFVRGL